MENSNRAHRVKGSITKKPTNQQLKHWNKILIDSGLGEDVGRNPKKVDLAGHTAELDIKVNQLIARKKGPKRPKGRGPE